MVKCKAKLTGKVVRSSINSSRDRIQQKETACLSSSLSSSCPSQSRSLQPLCSSSSQNDPNADASSPLSLRNFSPNPMITGLILIPMAFLKKAVSSFSPTDIMRLIKSYSAEHNVQLEDTDLTMFGSDEELVCNIKTYWSFPGSHEKFEMPLTTPYDSSHLIYKNLKNENWVSKQGLYAFLQHLVPSGSSEEWEYSLIQSGMAFYLKTKITLLKQKCEFIPLPMEELSQLGETITNSIKNYSDKKMSDNKQAVLAQNLEEAFEKWKTVLPVNPQDPEFTSIFELLKAYDKEFPVKKHLKMYVSVLRCISLLIEIYDDYMDKRSEWFLSRPQIGTGNSSATVRLFEDGDRKFVMTHELIGEMKYAQMNTSLIEKEEVIKMDYEIETIDFRKIFEILGSEMQKIEFIVSPIIRTKHGAAPIPSFDGKYCSLSSDVILEILRAAISVYNVYRKMKKTKDNDIIFTIFNNFLNRQFSIESEELFFIDFERAEKLKWFCVNYFHAKTMKLSNETHTVKPIGTTGFSVDDLKKELKRLDLISFYPQLIDYAQKVYDVIKQRKNENVLRTCDMFDALEECQLIYICKKLPELFKFLHQQNACDRILLECDLCQKKTLKPETSTKVTESKNVQEQDVISKNLDEPEEQQAELEKNIVADFQNGKSQIKKNASKPEMVPSKNQNAPVLEKQSKSCEKCFRTSQYCNEAKENLKLEQSKTKKLEIENKGLKKELEESQKRELEKDEQIEMLKLQLASRKTSLSSELTEKLSLDTEMKDIPSTSTLFTASSSVMLRAPSWKNSRFSPEVRNILFELINTRDCFFMDNLMNQATLLVHKIKTKSNKKSVQDEANRELKMFQKNFTAYSEAIESTIQFIRSNPEITLEKVPSLPEYPTFSASFFKMYEEEVLGKTQIADDELEDKECLICLHSMKSLDQTFKCSKCRRRFHKPCALKWFKIKVICPTCDNEKIQSS